MKLKTLSKLALKHIRNDFAEAMYLNLNNDSTKPTVVYGVLSERCNYKCRYCHYWKADNNLDEMSVDEWKKALLSIKDFIGPYHIEFTGGEPSIKKGFYELCQFCHDNGIQWGVTTNGSCLNENKIPLLVKAKPFNVNLSIDSHVDEIHNYARGVKGSLERITKGIKLLVAERDKQKADFPIIVKPTVHAKNLHIIHEIPEWAKNLGATAVNFQPVDIDGWTEDLYEELWIKEDRYDELEETSKKLIKMKKNGAAIMNSELLLSLWKAHFNQDKAPKKALPCRIGMRNLFIRPDGNVEVCWHFPSLGNLRTQSAKEIWTGEKAKKIRKNTVNCKRLCLFTCLSQKTIFDKVKMAFTLMFNKN